MINTVGLEDNRLSVVVYKLLVGFQPKFLKIAFEVCGTNSTQSSSVFLTELVRVFDRFDKINHRLHFYCTIDRLSSFNCTVYLSLNLGYCCNSR